MLFAILVMDSHTNAQTSVPAGNVSGTWSLAGSPYKVQGHVLVPDDLTLTIEPGVTVEFQGHYKLFVNGCILGRILQKLQMIVEQWVIQ